jgi:hypothetical protein
MGKGVKSRVSALLPRAAIGMLTMSLLTACNLPSVQPTPDMVATLAAVTIAASDSTASPDQPPGSPSPVASGTSATERPSPNPEGTETIVSCTNRLRFLKDVSVPDNTRMSPGDAFTKEWRVRNTGSCGWTSEYRLVFQSGNIMGGPAEGVPLPDPVAPGEDVVLSVKLTAPEVPGRYKGYWLLQDGFGVDFGYGDDADEAFWVQIRVRAATAEPTQEGE